MLMLIKNCSFPRYDLTFTLLCHFKKQNSEIPQFFKLWLTVACKLSVAFLSVYQLLF